MHPETDRPKAVAFDLDGLMFNTEDLYRHVCGELVARRGEQIVNDVLDRMMGRPSPLALQILIDWYRFPCTAEELQCESDQLFIDSLPQVLRPMRGLLSLLAALEEAGIGKAIATSSRRHLAEAVLAPFRLQERFAFVLTAENVTRGKPDPEIYLTAAQQLGVSPHQLLVLEDSQVGCQAAVAAGTYAVAVPGEHSAHHSFAGARLVAEHLEDRRIYAALGIR